MAVAAALALAVGGCGRPTDQAAARAAAKPVPTAEEMEYLQARADASCRCQRARGSRYDDPVCWADFDRSIDRFEHSMSATACMEASETRICFGDSDDFDLSFKNCIFRRRPYNACSAEEAAARAGAKEGCG